MRRALLARDPNAVIRITANFRSAAAILGHINHAFAGPLSITLAPCLSMASR